MYIGRDFSLHIHVYIYRIYGISLTDTRFPYLALQGSKPIESFYNVLIIPAKHHRLIILIIETIYLYNCSLMYAKAVAFLTEWYITYNAVICCLLSLLIDQ